ncbi:hypothetical protein Vadar_003909 [Vaccinium darrowii]|uniref:Uncharacterized protein n=1 Tax=Vaccinium darrowii TaxID=229202 RepID=A0ACB7XN41_9ERIC|nr:hypothetical protein Vadar_003909 [Vaccinium darrowii]
MTRTRKKSRSDVPSELLFAMEMEEAMIGSQDYMSRLPDDCLAAVFNFLCSDDRKNVSIVSKRMLKVEAQSRRRLTLNPARSDLIGFGSVLSRFKSVTELVLRCVDRRPADVDDALILIGKHCGNKIKELVLIGLNFSCIGLGSVFALFPKLEGLAMYDCKTLGDVKISCIASKCVGLKKLRIKGCAVTDEGIKAFCWGCPNLVEIKVNKCSGVTREVVDWFGARRGSLVVKLDVSEIEADDGLELDSSSDSDGGGGGGGDDDGGGGVDIPQIIVRHPVSNWRPPIFRLRYGNFGGRNPARGA